MNLLTCVIFGGSGTIGSHLARHLISHGLASKVILADIVAPRADRNVFTPGIQHIVVDVRTPPQSWALPDRVDFIANFAAVHREPGHELHEYYETNLPGADNVCAFAEKVGCQEIIFTSSIAPYGPTESIKTEESIPTPISAYGGSKLAAEKIHMAWQRAGAGRKLVIVRPGVIFGPGECGNVTRLMKATLNRYFLYMGNRDTRKAGGYVKELANTMVWALAQVPAAGGVILYNFSMDQPPTVEEYVNTVCKVAKVNRWVPSMPYALLLGMSYVIEAIARPLGIKQPISPIRIKKLVKSNNIEPTVLRREGYQYQYTLESAMVDWRQERPDEWR